MASSSSAVLLSPKDREPLKCVNDANFAVICAFLEQFGAICAIEHPNFLDLQKMLEDDEGHADLIDLHVKLLRKLKFSVNVERWERSLAKFCHTYSTNDAWELERFSYKLLKLPIRLRILKNLLETQFDNNPKFKTAVNVLPTPTLRPVPLGRDKMGNVYWRTLDADCNIRIYQENQDEESLRIVASNRDELAKLIAVLSGKEPMTPNLAGLVDEDSSSNSDIVTAPVAEEPKDNIVQKDAVEEDAEVEQQGFRLANTARPTEPSSRITLLGKNNLDKINKFKMLNAKNQAEEEESDENEDEEEDENYDEEDMDIEPDVGSVIQERVVYIRGEGAGKSNRCANYHVVNPEPDDAICGEAIEEPVVYISGQGAGRECDGGNPGEGESNNSPSEAISTPPVAAAPLPRPMFFFGRPGCLKLSPMKTTAATSAGSSEGEEKKKVTLVAYEDSNSASSNSQESQGAADTNVGQKEAVDALSIITTREVETSETPADDLKVAEVSMAVKDHQKDSILDDCPVESESTGASEELPSEKVPGQCQGQMQAVSEVNNVASDEASKDELVGEQVALKDVTENAEEMKSESTPINDEEMVTSASGEVDKVKVTAEDHINNPPEMEHDQITSELDVCDNVAGGPPVNHERTPELDLQKPLEASVDSSNSEENKETRQQISSPEHTTSDVGNVTQMESVESSAEESPKDYNEIEVEVTGVEVAVLEDVKAVLSSTPMEEGESIPLIKSVEEKESVNMESKSPSNAVDNEEHEIQAIETDSKPQPEIGNDTVNRDNDEDQESRQQECEIKTALEDVSKNISNVDNTIQEAENVSSIKPPASPAEYEPATEKPDTTEIAGQSENTVQPESGIKMPIDADDQEELLSTEEESAVARGNSMAESSLAIESESFPEIDQSVLPQDTDKEENTPVIETQEDAPQPLAINQQLCVVTEDIKVVESSCNVGSDIENISIPSPSTTETGTDTHLPYSPSVREIKDDSMSHEAATDSALISARTLSENPIDTVQEVNTATSVESSPIKEDPVCETESGPILTDAETTGSLGEDSQVVEDPPVPVIVSVEDDITVSDDVPVSEIILLSKNITVEKEHDHLAGEIAESSNTTIVNRSLMVEDIPAVEDTTIIQDAPAENKSVPATTVTIEPVPESITETLSTSSVEMATALKQTPEDHQKVESPEVIQKPLSVTEPLIESESEDDGGHFDQGPNEPMDAENDADEYEPTAQLTPIESPTNRKEEKGSNFTNVSVNSATVEQSEREIKESIAKESTIDFVKEDRPQESVDEPSVPQETLSISVEEVQQQPTEQSEPPTRSRRGRRSDPVVAELGNTEILTETPRATRGRGNQKESPVAGGPLRTSPQTKKNSRKRKSSESTPVVAEAETAVKVEEPNEKEVDKVGIKEEDQTPIDPVEKTSVPDVNENDIAAVQPESDGDDEDDGEEKRKPTGKKASVKGRKGRRGRKAPAKKATPVDPVVAPAEESMPIKEELVVTEPVKEEEKVVVETPTASPAKKGRRQNRMMGLYMDEIQAQEDVGSVRQSRRIAQIKIKEETDRRIQEEVALGKMRDSMKKKTESSGDEDSGSEKGKGKGRGKKGKRAEKEKKVKTTWHSNSNTSDEDEKDDEDDNFGVVEEDPGSPLFKSDHEFSCESDVDGDEYVPTKMARTVVAKKKAKAASDDDSESDNPDHACQKCSKHDHPEWILLCDTCDKGYHCSCLIPVLFIIPEGDWYCPTCQHTKLLEQLNMELEKLDNALEEREREAELLRRQAINNVCANNILPEDTVEPEEKRSKERQSNSRQESSRNDFSSEEDTEGEQDSEDSDDMPIYKLRRRKQTKVSYRFNDYDELINKAIGHDMRDDRELNDIIQSNAAGGTEEGKAGNLGRGKDIATIMEADDNEKTRKELSQSDASGSDDDDGDDVPLGGRKKANVDDSDGSEVVVRKRNNKHQGKGKAAKKVGRKKNRKLNNLDSSSDDDGSDEDFEGSSAEDSEDSAEESGSLDSDSSMELAQYRKKGKNTTTRRSGRARVKRFDNDFINDNDDDENSIEKPPPVKRKKKKEESDFSDFDEDDEDGSSDEMEEQDLDSADLCDDSESEDSEDRPWGSKKKKKKSTTTSTKVFSKNPIMSAGKVPRNKTKRKPASDDDDENSFKASLLKKKKKPTIASDDEDGENSVPAESRPIRRTRGKKINFLEVVESGSSDDGIKPGVKRPDTPPEEREQFIKRQEEIKKMLAAKNAEAALNAGTPKIEPLKLKLSGAAGSRQDPNSLSTIPRNIIQSAKALDTEFVKSRESGEEFDNELPDDFNPEDMDEEDLDRIMEEDGDFAVQQLKMANEAARLKKQPPKLVKEENKEAEKGKMAGSLVEPIAPISAQPPHDLLANKAPPPGYPTMHHMMIPGDGAAPLPISHSVIQGMPARPSHLPPPPQLISDGHRHPNSRAQHPMHQMEMGRMPLLPPNMIPQAGPPAQIPGRFMHGGPPSAAGPSGVPQNVIVGPPQHNLLGSPPFPPYGSPSAAHPSGPPHVQPQEELPKVVPKKRGRKPKEAVPVVAPLESAMQLPGHAGEPGIPTTVLTHEANATTSTKKGGGRRKKITPSREELQAQAASAAQPSGKPLPPESRGSILSERLEAASGELKQAPPVSQTLAAQPAFGGASVIQRLPQPGGGPPSAMVGGPYPGQGTPPRFYQSQGIGGPPPPNAAALGMHHMQPHGNERMHFMQHHSRHMPPHMYRPPSSIYGNPYQGQHVPPPQLQRSQLDTHGVRPMHPQDYSNSYLPPQFGPYIHGHPPNSHVRGPAPPSSSGDDPKGKKVAVAPPTTTALPPGPPHPSQLAQYEALKAAGGPHYNSPYPAPHPGAIMRHQGDPQAHPDAPSNPGEFSGLVSYFSAQHDDLEQQ